MSVSRNAAKGSSRLSLAIANALVLALASPSVLAEAAADAPSSDPVNLDAIIVTALAPVSPLQFEASPKLPRQPVPASDGADYLKTIPGFSAVRNGGTNGDPVLRGMFGSRLNLMTNDGAMPGACPSRMDNPMSYVSPENYDNLVVIKGPQTVLWGPGASAGTVRFERERKHFDAPTLELAGSLLGGSFGRNDQVIDATYGDRLGYLRFSGNRSDSDDYGDGDGNKVGSAWEKWNTDVAAGWTPDEDTLLEVSAGFGDGESRYATRGMDGSRFKRENFGLRFEKHNLGEYLHHVEATAYHNLADHVMDNYSLREPNPDSAMPMPMASNVERRTAGGRAAAEWSAAQWELTAGMDYQDSRHRRRSAMGRGAFRAAPWTTDARFENLGVFAEGTWFHGDYTRLIAGARVDRASATDERQMLSGGGHGHGGGHAMPNPTAGLEREETLSAGFFRYERDAANAPLTWYAGLGHTERMPDYWELFSPDMGPLGSANAFAGIDTEKTTQLDVGLQYGGEKFDAWVSAYAGRINDYIQFHYMDSGMSAASNVDADIRGAELGVEYRPDEQWKLGGTLAYARGEIRGANRPMPQMTPLEARLTAAWDNGTWSAGVLLRAVDGQDRIAPGYGNVVGQDLDASPGFATLALNGGYRFNGKLQLTAGVDNVFDRTYSEHLNLAGNADFGYPADPVRINEPGRTAWVKLNYNW